MIRRTLILAAAGALVATSALSAAKAGAITIDDAWSRPAPAGRNGVGYVTLTNRGAADRLVGASSPVAGRIEIHESMVMNGRAMMHPRPNGAPLPAGQTVHLKPEGWHLMLMGLKKPLKVGETVPVTLKFQKAGSVQVAFAVRAGVGTPAAAPHH